MSTGPCRPHGRTQLRIIKGHPQEKQPTLHRGFSATSVLTAAGGGGRSHIYRMTSTVRISEGQTGPWWGGAWDTGTGAEDRTLALRPTCYSVQSDFGPRDGICHWWAPEHLLC